MLGDVSWPDPDAPRAEVAVFIRERTPVADLSVEDLRLEARRGRALRQEIERLAERGEGYASARELRRALAMEGSER